MKTEMIKFNSDRNISYQIETRIIEKGGKKSVSKRALTEAAKKHIDNIYENYSILEKAYEHSRICPVYQMEDSIEFDYIDGESLSVKYGKAIEAGDKTKFLELVNTQIELIKGDCYNDCIFHETPDFNKVFGDGSAFESQKGLKIVNFEATPQNIIFKKGTGIPVFIDYEWVFQFPVPIDLVLYHCIIVVGSFYLSDLESLISREELLGFLNIQTDIEILEKAWRKFFQKLDGPEDSSLTKVKTEQYLKGITDIGEIVLENYELHGVYQYNTELEKNIKTQESCIETLNQGICSQNEYVATIETVLKDQQEYIENLEVSKENQQSYIGSLEESGINQQNYIKLCEESSNKLIKDVNKLEKNLRLCENKVEKQKILIGKQQEKIFNQAEIINSIKASLFGKLVFRKILK